MCSLKETHKKRLSSVFSEKFTTNKTVKNSYTGCFNRMNPKTKKEYMAVSNVSAQVTDLLRWMGVYLLE